MTDTVYITTATSTRTGQTVLAAATSWPPDAGQQRQLLRDYLDRKLGWTDYDIHDAGDRTLRTEDLDRVLDCYSDLKVTALPLRTTVPT